MSAWIKAMWCGLFHGGGTIQRDPLDRINWQCSRCGRWSAPLYKEARKP